jgi:hypothetical protein
VSNPAKRKGTDWENEVVALMHKGGIPAAHREVLHGPKDVGDVGGLALAVSCKATARMELPAALREAKKQAITAEKWLAVVFWKVARRPASEALMVCDAKTGVELLRAYEESKRKGK